METDPKLGGTPPPYGKFHTFFLNFIEPFPKVTSPSALMLPSSLKAVQVYRPPSARWTEPTKPLAAPFRV